MRAKLTHTITFNLNIKIDCQIRTLIKKIKSILLTADIILIWHFGEDHTGKPLFYLNISFSVQIEKIINMTPVTAHCLWWTAFSVTYFPVSDDCLLAHQTKAHRQQPQTLWCWVSLVKRWRSVQHPPPLLEQHRLASPYSAPLLLFSAVGSL